MYNKETLSGKEMLNVMTKNDKRKCFWESQILENVKREYSFEVFKQHINL